MLIWKNVSCSKIQMRKHNFEKIIAEGHHFRCLSIFQPFIWYDNFYIRMTRIFHIIVYHNHLNNKPFTCQNDKLIKNMINFGSGSVYIMDAIVVYVYRGIGRNFFISPSFGNIAL